MRCFVFRRTKPIHGFSRADTHGTSRWRPRLRRRRLVCEHLEDRRLLSVSPILGEPGLAPAVDAGPDAAIDEGGLFTANGLFIDTDSASWTATVDYGDGSGEQALTLNTDKTFQLSHRYADNNKDKLGNLIPYTVTVTVTDDGSLTGSDTLQLTVNNVAPSLWVRGRRTVAEGEQLNVQDIAVFTDPGFDNPPGGSVETFTYSIDWGDGSKSDQGVATIDAPGSAGVVARGTLDGVHTYADDGHYSVAITVTDDDGGTSVARFLTVVVTNVAPQAVDAGANQTVNEGQNVVFAGSFTDAGTLDTHTILWDFGDGTTASGTLTPTHVYADNGLYAVTLTVTDDDGAASGDTLNVTVNNVAPTVDAGPDQAVNEGQAVTLAALAFNDKGTRDTHTVSINWGDGTLGSGTVGESPFGPPGSTAGATGTVAASHVYADNGVYTVTITVTDDEGLSGTDTLTVNVANVAPTLTVADNKTIAEGQSLVITNLGSFTDPGFANPLNPGDEKEETFTYSVNWGDGTTSTTGSATIDVLGLAGTATAGSFDGSHVYADNGTYTVAVTVTDDDGGADTKTLQVTVTNVAPTLQVVGNQEVVAGVLLSLTNIGVFSDPGFANAFNPGPEKDETFTFSIDWGDTTAPTTGAATIDTTGSAGTPTLGSFDGSHTYAAAGQYVVTVRVEDDDSGADEAVFNVHVTAAASSMLLAAAPGDVGDETAGQNDELPPEDEPDLLPPAGEGLGDDVSEPGEAALLAPPALVNQPPTLWVIGDQSVGNGSVSFVDLGVFLDDDSTGPFTYSIDWNDGTPASTGTADIDLSGPPTWGSLDGQHVYAVGGVYLVAVTVTDEQANTSGTETFELTVTSVAPVAADDYYVFDGVGVMQVGASGGLLANDSDPDGDSLTAAAVGAPIIDPSKGTVSLLPDGSFTYTPPSEDYVGRVTFQYKADDGLLQSQPATVTIDVGMNGVISGHVYAANQDSRFKPDKLPLPGVVVELEAIDDTALRGVVQMNTITDDDGFYSFDGLRAGTYRITERQPAICLDGATHVISNVVIDLGGGNQQSTGNDFAERWLRPQYVSIGNFLATTILANPTTYGWSVGLRERVARAEQAAGNAELAAAVRLGEVVEFARRGSTVTITGTRADEQFAFAPGASENTVTIDGAVHTFASDAVTHVKFIGGGGDDKAELTDSSGNDLLEGEYNWAKLSGVDFACELLDFASIKVTSTSGNDTKDIANTIDYLLQTVGNWTDVP